MPPPFMVSEQPVGLSVKIAGVCLWLPTIEVAVAPTPTVGEPPKIWMNASGRL